MTHQTLTISTLARKVEVNVETIRYYQRRGLLRQPLKPGDGARHCDETDVARMGFIKSAQRLGFTLEEIGLLLQVFREQGLPVVHVRHEFPGEAAPFFQPGSDGAKAHWLVAPHVHEPVVLKREINGFQGTRLKEVLDSYQVERLVICGAMSHMCIDSTTRAARDLGYECIVVSDACATHAMEFDGVGVSAEQVHAAFMHALGFAYGKVISTTQALLDINRPMQREGA